MITYVFYVVEQYSNVVNDFQLLCDTIPGG